jgi:hypothetical protein
MAAPVIMIFLFIAFFKLSELTLLPFLAKIRRTRFLDTTKKFQTNDIKVDPLDIAIKQSHALYEDTATVDQKKHMVDELPKKNLSDDLLS